MKKHNFGAGPCILPGAVLETAGEAVKNFNGLSILEISHRSPEFEQVIQDTEILIRDLLKVPDDYSVLFLQGGASLQFCMVPMNFLKGGKAVYLNRGYFGQKAIKEARLFGEVVEEMDFDNAAYFHCTSNNTIEGTQMVSFPETGVPLICDMSSDIFTRELDISKFALIYAGAQKNMGPAGMTLVIARNSFLDTVKHPVPTMLDYRTYRDNHSLFNTPPVFSIYAAMLNLQWLKAQGGVAAIRRQNLLKAQALYNEIDRNPLFESLAPRAEASVMNITFKMKDEKREAGFLQFAKDRGMVGINGYRTVGGFRASLYNALPLSSVQALIQTMQEYARN